MGHLGIVLGFELKRFLRGSQGALFLVFTGAVFAWVCYEIVEYAKLAPLMEAAAGQGASNPGALVSAMGDLFILASVGWFVDVSPEQIQGLVGVHRIPLPLIFGYLALIATAPLLTMLASLDQTASDIGSKHLRYLLLRTRRGTLYLGKMLAVVIWVAFGLAVAVVAVGATASLAKGLGGMSTGDLVGHLVKMWAIAFAYALPFITLVGATGALSGHPGGAIGIAVLLQLVVAALSAAGSLMGQEVLVSMKYAFPTALEGLLLSQEAGELGKSLAFAGGHGLLYFLLGWLLFRSRDV